MIRPGVFACLLILTGCGGSDAPAATCSGPLRVRTLGDSTMVGWSATDPQGNPSRDLQAYLDARFGKGVAVVTSKAVSGTRSTQLVAGTDGLNPPWPQSVADADIVVVNHGINDMQAKDLAGYKAALETIASTPKVRVIFETQNATKQWDGSAYAQAMREVARAHSLPVADTFAFTVDKTAQLSDWGHPTAALYSQIGANVLQPVVGAEVARMRCQ